MSAHALLNLLNELGEKDKMLGFQYLSTRCCVSSFKIISCWVPEKIFKGFYHTWARWPSWSCDHAHLKEILFP